VNGLRLYVRYVAISLRSQVQYRASFFLQTSAMFVAAGAELVGVWALFTRFGSLNDWTLPEAAVFFGTVYMAFATADALVTGFDQFASMIKAGDFDRILLRPRSTVLQLTGQELTLRRLGRFFAGAVSLGWGLRALPGAISLLKIAVLLSAVAGGACLFFGIIVLQATLAFFTIESLEIMNVFTYGGVEAAQYPLAIYRPWFRRFFTFVVPVGCVAYYPLLIVTDRTTSGGVPVLLACLAPLAGPCFLFLALCTWRVGVRHYQSTGS
jgi:ABC-2 type transport system permease protein